MSSGESLGALNAKLATYEGQLRQIDELVAGDPRPEYLKLKTDLLEVIRLTQDLVALAKKSEAGGAAGGVAPEGKKRKADAMSSRAFPVGGRCEARTEAGAFEPGE